MSESIAVGLTSVVVLGVGSQWLAWRLRVPSILLLLTVGVLVGPVSGFLDPDALFGDLLLPLVSIAVALILYEGGLSLRFAELGDSTRVVVRLVTIGAVVTWVLGAAAAWWVFDLDLRLAVLLGAVFTVTGPTVILPLLRHIRPTGSAGRILKWEGIVIDPIGAMLAVLVFEFLLAGELEVATAHVAWALAKTVVVGSGLGLAAAWLLASLIQRHWVPEPLQSSVSLMLAVAAFAAANEVQHEAGLFSVTVMGIALANQRRADMRPILEFKENLRVLFISSLFILLGARIDLGSLGRIVLPGLCFLALLVLVVRPVSVWLSCLGSSLPRNERLFLAWMAPRGIVAAAVTSIFALRLQQEGFAGADRLVSAAFAVILGSVAVYGLTAPRVARWLGLSDPNPQGVLFVGAHRWVRDVAKALHDRGVPVLLVDSNREHIRRARMDGLPTHLGSIVSEHILDDLELGGLGRLLAVTPNDWVNVLAIQSFEREFGKQHTFQLAAGGQNDRQKEAHEHLYGQELFDDAATSDELIRRVALGATVKATGLTEEFDFAAFRERYGESALVLFVQDPRGRIQVVTANSPGKPKPGQTVIALVDAEPGAPQPRSATEKSLAPRRPAAPESTGP